MNDSNINMTLPQQVLKGVVAVVGCDGTGKSTLTADLLKYMGKRGRTERRYLGLISGEAGNKIKHLPFIGVKFERYLAAKAARAQDVKQKLPGTGTAIIMHLFSHWRIGQLRKVIRLSEAGVLIIADRYPQAQIAGFNYDGPGFTATPNSNWLLRYLAAREQKLYDWMASQQPTLIIRLNIDAETAHARKPDHSLNELRDKSAIMPQLHYSGAHILDIDARLPYAQVLSAALQAIDPLLSNAKK